MRWKQFNNRHWVKSRCTYKTSIYDSPLFFSTEATIRFCQLFHDYTKFYVHQRENHIDLWENCQHRLCESSLPEKIPGLQLETELIKCQEECNLTAQQIEEIANKKREIEELYFKYWFFNRIDLPSEALKVLENSNVTTQSNNHISQVPFCITFIMLCCFSSYNSKLEVCRVGFYSFNSYGC